MTNTKNGYLIDKWQGTPFLTKDNKIDIVFSTDDGIIYLSDLKDNETINNVGWFSSLFKTIAKVAIGVLVASTVIAVAVVAVPAVIPASVAVVGSASTAIMTGAATATIATTALATASIALLTATISNVLNTMNKEINNHNISVIYHNKLTKSIIQTLVKEGVNDGFNTDKKIAVYLGRTGEYEKFLEKSNYKNLIFKFDGIRWDDLINIYGREGMWLVNLAFLKICYRLEIKNMLEFRLTTDYHPYENKIIPIDQPGGFYSRELNYLRSTNHKFSPFKNMFLYYEVFI